MEDRGNQKVMKVCSVHDVQWHTGVYTLYMYTIPGQNKCTDKSILSCNVYITVQRSEY